MNKKLRAERTDPIVRHYLRKAAARARALKKLKCTACTNNHSRSPAPPAPLPLWPKLAFPLYPAVKLFYVAARAVRRLIYLRRVKESIDAQALIIDSNACDLCGEAFEGCAAEGVYRAKCRRNCIAAAERLEAVKAGYYAERYRLTAPLECPHHCRKMIEETMSAGFKADTKATESADRLF